jgi:hypothetical protein
MFRTMSGYKAQYQSLTLLVVEEFNEWKVLLLSPDATIHGVRQFSEAKAKEHAMAVAREYIHDRKHEEPPDITALTWVPTAADDWLVSR